LHGPHIPTPSRTIQQRHRTDRSPRSRDRPHPQALQQQSSTLAAAIGARVAAAPRCSLGGDSAGPPTMRGRQHMVGVSKLSHWIANLGLRNTNGNDKRTERKLDKRRRKAAKTYNKN